MGAGLPGLLSFAGCFGRWPETSIGGSAPWRGFVCSPGGAVCAAPGLTAEQVVRRADVERKKNENARKRPRLRPQLLIRKTQRPKATLNSSPRRFGRLAPAASPFGSRSTAGLATDARTPRPNALARDLLLTAGLLARGSLPFAAFPGPRSQWTFG